MFFLKESLKWELSKYRKIYTFLKYHIKFFETIKQYEDLLKIKLMELQHFDKMFLMTQDQNASKFK